MVDLRKRKAATDAVPNPPVKKSNSAKSSTVNKKGAPATNGSSPPTKVAVGDTVDLDGFGGEVETNEGEKITLKDLVDKSENGVVLFTYPKASTPGCTTQACLFRDDFSALTSTGFSIYGLSTDSPKSNTNFKTKQNLPYTLLCDPSATLISAIGMKKSPSGTTRGVFVVNKQGKVSAASPGGPAATVDVVRKLIGAENTTANEESAKGENSGERVEEDKPIAGDDDETQAESSAEVAAQVADSAQKLDGEAHA